MVRCSFCKKKAGLNYITCNYCKCDVCISCRAPETHNCEKMSDKIQQDVDKLKEKLEREKTVAPKLTPF